MIGGWMNEYSLHVFWVCFLGHPDTNFSLWGDLDLPVGRAFTDRSQIPGRSEGHAPHSYPTGGPCDPKNPWLDDMPRVTLQEGPVQKLVYSVKLHTMMYPAYLLGIENPLHFWASPSKQKFAKVPGRDYMEGGGASLWSRWHLVPFSKTSKYW